MKKLILFIVLNSLLASCSHQKDQHRDTQRFVYRTEIRKTERGYQLYRNGEPYFIKGAGGYNQFAELKRRGGNSIRVWDTDEAERILNEARQQGLTVMLGLWISPESSGFNYYDTQAVAQQLQKLKKIVRKYKDHPALLMWCVGNEWVFGTKTIEIYDAVNDIARMIHEVDPNHPVTTATVAIPQHLRLLAKRCPELDVLSINAYGNLQTVEKTLRENDWSGPYILTEYGILGYWEVRHVQWNAPIEQTSSQKANFVKENYERNIVHHDYCLGSYIFYWGYKPETTPTWFSLLDAQGNLTPLADVLQVLWTNTRPANRAPFVSQLTIDRHYNAVNAFLRTDSLHTANILALDPEGDSLSYVWEILPENRFSRKNDPDSTLYQLLDNGKPEIRFVLPRKSGPYRLYVYVYDQHQHVATANIPFLVR